jgi:hypothetical protein
MRIFFLPPIKIPPLLSQVLSFQGRSPTRNKRYFPLPDFVSPFLSPALKVEKSRGEKWYNGKEIQIE